MHVYMYIYICINLCIHTYIYIIACVHIHILNFKPSLHYESMPWKVLCCRLLMAAVEKFKGRSDSLAHAEVLTCRPVLL